MSEAFIRNLAMACVPKIAAKVELAVMQAVRDELPKVIESTLHEMYGGENVRFYVSKRGLNERRERNALIRARFDGSNFDELAGQFSISARTVRRIVGIK